MKRFIFFMGLVISLGAQAQDSSKNNTSNDVSKKQEMVTVEPTYITPMDNKGNYALAPYRQRKGDWGTYFGLTYSRYNPSLYASDQAPPDIDFEKLYSNPESPLLEAVIHWNWHTSAGSFGLELGAGMYTNKSEDTVNVGGTPTNFDLQLKLTPLRLGVNYTLNTLSGSEPYVCPYVSGGVFTMRYKETQADVSTTGNTQAAPYAAAGFLFQLDWLDPHSAKQAFINSGIQNTFVFAEVRRFWKAQAADDPNFKSQAHGNAGLKLEF